MLSIIAQKRTQTSKKISVILAGLFAEYNDLEYNLYL